jgi:DNA-binding protein Fis
MSDESIYCSVSKIIRNHLESIDETIDSNNKSNLYSMALQEFNRAVINTTVEHCNNTSKAARILGISRTTIRSKIKSFDNK